MDVVVDVLAQLENFTITKEALEVDERDYEGGGRGAQGLGNVEGSIQVELTRARRSRTERRSPESTLGRALDTSSSPTKTASTP